MPRLMRACTTKKIDMKLDSQDICWAITRTPKRLVALMKEPEWHNNIFIGGGFLRSIVAGEDINDVDVFVKTKKEAEVPAYKLAFEKEDVVATNNAFTVKGKMPIQNINRCVF